MDNRQKRSMSACDRAVEYLDHTPLQPMPPLLEKTASKLRVSVQRMRELAAQQAYAGSAVGGLPVGILSRQLRREKMMPLVRVARPLLKFASGVEKVMRVPHARSDALTVANAGLDMVKMLKPHQKLLRSAGLPTDFLAEMRRESEALADATKRHEKVRRLRSRATAALARELKEAREHLTVIEGILMFHQKDDVKLSMWKQSRRVGARIGRPKKQKRPPPPLVS